MKNEGKGSVTPINRTELSPFGIQLDSNVYYSSYYLSPSRMSSYGHQFNLAMETQGDSFLNIGSANSILKTLLSKQEKTVINFDLDIRTKPTITGVFPNLPFQKDSFDVVLCFQVLEHMPFQMLTSNLYELRRVAKKYVILSLPDISLSKNDRIKNSIYQLLGFPKEWKIYKSSTPKSEHFWEIGYEKISLEKIMDMFGSTKFTIEKHFRNILFRYHHFFVLNVHKAEILE